MCGLLLSLLFNLLYGWTAWNIFHFYGIGRESQASYYRINTLHVFNCLSFFPHGMNHSIILVVIHGLIAIIFMMWRWKNTSSIRKCARFYVNQLRNILCLFWRLLFIIHIDHVKWIWPKIENDNKTLNLWQLFFGKHNIALLWTVSSLFFILCFFSFHFYSVLLIVNFSHTESIASG